jgi:transposase
MFGLGAATCIYVAVGPTDMRKSFEGLFGLVKERFGCSPLSGHLFLFANARRNRLNVLYWDGYGTLGALRWRCSEEL